MKGTLNSRGWSTGELSPDLFGHTDLNKYQSALKVAKGWIINKRGVLQKCPGTSAVMPCKFPGLKNRLIPFKISFNQQYCLVFGDQYIHIIKNGKPVFNSPDPLQITSFPNSLNPTITLNVGSNDGVSATNFAVGMMMKFRTMASNGIFDFPQSGFILNVKDWWGLISSVTINATTTTFTVTDLNGNNIDSTSWGAYDQSVGISTVYEISTPYLNADLSLIKTTQSFDIMQLRHHLYARYQLENFSDTNWILVLNSLGPTQNQLIHKLSVSGGATSTNPYYYKVTTFNLDTKQESLPCPSITLTLNASQLIVNGFTIVLNGQQYLRLFLGSVSGFVAGNPFQVSNNVINFSNHSVIYLRPGIDYEIFDVGSNYIDTAISNSLQSGQIVAGNFAYAYGAPAANKITAISNTNPVVVTTQSAHGLTNGQEVNIQGTGIYGLDGLNFNATVQGSTTFSLNGVNGSNYNISSFIGTALSFVSATAVVSSNSPNTANPITLTGVLLSQVLNSNVIALVYASSALNSGYGFIGTCVPGNTTTAFSFLDSGIPPDSTLSPKVYTPLFVGSGNNPSACNFYQQRLIEFATDNNPQGLWATCIGDFNDFTIHNPIQENDAIIINVWSNELSQIFDSADAGFMVLMTDLGPLVCQGDSSGDFTPSTDLIRRYAFQGASQTPRPLTIFKNIVYLEANQAAMRDLEILVTPFYTYIDKSNDVSIYSEHLLQQSPISEWDYKLYPDSQIFSVRQDGNMVLTCYFQEQGINGFTWRDTEGQFLNVACVQEGTETTSYVTAQRENGAWIEYFNTPYWTDPTTNAIYTDGTVTYNGQLNDGTTAVLSGGTMFGQSVTATFNSNTGLSYLPGYLMLFRINSGTKDSNGNDIWWTARLNIQSNTINSATGTLMEAIQPGILGMTISDIRVCTNVVAGLWNLEGQEVSVVADGFVQSDANNDDTPLVVTNGQIQLTQSFGVINVGLPYNADFQTLDLDEAKGETYMDKKIGVPRVTMKLLNSGPAFVGPAFTEDLQGYEKMDVNKFREFEGYLSPTNLFTGICELNIDARYGFGGSFCLRSSAPLPFTILSLAPLVEIQS